MKSISAGMQQTSGLLDRKFFGQKQTKRNNKSLLTASNLSFQNIQLQFHRNLKISFQQILLTKNLEINYTNQSLGMRKTSWIRQIYHNQNRLIKLLQEDRISRRSQSDTLTSKVWRPATSLQISSLPLLCIRPLDFSHRLFLQTTPCTRTGCILDLSARVSADSIGKPSREYLFGLSCHRRVAAREPPRGCFLGRFQLFDLLSPGWNYLWANDDQTRFTSDIREHTLACDAALHCSRWT